jgi:hypothetical protein
MFWWFERNGRHARIEVLQPTPQTYELRFIDADGVQQIETFDDPRALAERQEALQQELLTHGWTGPHGWVV